ncbi:hypothetical protein DAI22_02g149800 [Oryza sativa Japonica Group]|nr:hypothetical protein DAI22_02g149800 [Oryza sativa Japonica Group]
MALQAFSPYSFAFLLLSPPSISCITTHATSPRVTAMASSPNNSTGVITPTPSTSTANRSFRNWSEKCGHVTTSTPWAMDSSIEFQLQWVTKPSRARLRSPSHARSRLHSLE